MGTLPCECKALDSNKAFSQHGLIHSSQIPQVRGHQFHLTDVRPQSTWRLGQETWPVSGRPRVHSLIFSVANPFPFYQCNSTWAWSGGRNSKRPPMCVHACMYMSSTGISESLNKHLLSSDWIYRPVLETEE